MCRAPGIARGVLDRIAQLRSGESRVVESRVVLAAGGPGIQVLQLDVQDGGLDLVDAEIAADEGVVILRLAPVDAQDIHPLGQGGVIGDAHAGVAEGAEVLGREERQAADVAEAAGALVIRIFGADRLRGVLDHPQAVIAGEVHERKHVRGLAVEMHRHEGFDRGRRCSY